jgi:hypothetical protein
VVEIEPKTEEKFSLVWKTKLGFWHNLGKSQSKMKLKEETYERRS